MLFCALLTFLTPRGSEAAPPHTILPARSDVIAIMERVATWQLAALKAVPAQPAPAANDPRNWRQAVFWLGLTALADRSGDARFRDSIFAEGRSVDWHLGPRLHHADDHLIGQVWLWAATHGAGAGAIAPTRRRMDALLADQRFVNLEFVPGRHGNAECAVRWCWSDALFMAPATLFGLSRYTQDPRYRGFADREYRATAHLLYDRDERLFFRDSRFITQRDANGGKMFWSRGNGWVLAGLARSIALMEPDDPGRSFYIGLFRDMAGRVAELQGEEGYWGASLLGGKQAPETSGTAFFVYALSWGINAGLLDRERFTPVAVHGWAALVRAVAPDGRLGWVQPIGDRPGEVRQSDSEPFGAGALLLAGAEVSDLAQPSD